MFFRSTLLAGVAAISLMGSANAGLIDITGQTTDGTPTVINYIEVDTGPLTHIEFNLHFEAFDPSWGSEAAITLKHVPTGTIYTAGGADYLSYDVDFDWDSNPGIYWASESLATTLLDKSGLWEITLSETFDDSSISPDGQYLATSTINLATAIAEPGTLALFGLGLAGLGLARRRKTS